MQFDTVKTGFERALCGRAKLFDDAGNLFDIERAMRRCGHETVFGQRDAIERDHGRRNGIDPARHFNVTLTATVNQLHEDAATLCVNGVGDCFPAVHLTIVIETGRTQIGARDNRYANAFDDFEAAFRSALAVEIGHHRARNVTGLDCAQTRHRSKHDAMGEGISADLPGSEQVSHDLSLGNWCKLIELDCVPIR